LIVENAYFILRWASLLTLSVTIFACLFRAVLGPRFTDRVVSVNIICTKAIVMISIVSFILGDSSLIDIAIVYAMISFLAIIVLSKCYLHRKRISPVHIDSAASPVGKSVGDSADR